MGARRRFRGRIAGVGSSSGVRVVVGWWHESPFGAFGDAMVERADGHRVLLAPSDEVAALVSGTYVFDEVRVEAFTVDAVDSAWAVSSPSLALRLSVGGRMPLGRLLRVVPPVLARSPAWATLVDPVARVAMDGVRTRGVAREGRREFYGATDVHEVTSLEGRLDGIPLGDLRTVSPPCRFGFSSTPRHPSVVDVVTTIGDTT